MDLLVVIEKMAMLVILMLIGYVCAKLKVTGPESNKHASKIVMDILLVGTILNSVINIEPSLTNVEIFQFFCLLLLEFVILGAIAWLFPHIIQIRGNDERVSRTILLFMNNGFVGLPVVQVVFGTEAVFYASLSNIPFNILLYTVGIAQLCETPEDKKFSIKNILTAPMIATFIAVLLFLFRLHVPVVIANTISSLASATVPMSMLVIGTSLGNIPLKNAFGDWRAYALSAIKLLVCPIVVWAIIRLFISNAMMLGILVIIAACPVAMVLTVLCIQYDRDESLASKTIFLSTVFSAATIPFIIWLLL